VGLAVKVMLPPGQMEVELALIDTAGILPVVTVIVIGLLVAVVGFAQGSVLVITTVTTSPFASGDVVVKTEEVCPGTVTPLIFH
jgi:hypothetical protein